MITTNWTTFNKYIGPEARNLAKVLKSLGINSAHFKGAEGFYRRVGDSMEIKVTYSQSASMGMTGNYEYLLPPGFEIDKNKLCNGANPHTFTQHMGENNILTHATLPIIGWTEE